MVRQILYSLLGLFLLAITIPVGAVQSGSSTVHAVLFYRPTCVYCHKAIEQTLLPLSKEYGAHLELVLVNASTEVGGELLKAMGDWYGLGEGQRVVPSLLVGDQLLIGSGDIGREFPEIVSSGVAHGGIPMPYVPGLEEVLSGKPFDGPALLQESQEGAPLRANSAEELAAVLNRTLWDRLTQDPWGNSLAIVLLVAMACSVGFVGTLWVLRGGRANPNRWAPLAIPFLACVGVGIASYLTYIDLSGAQPVCGIGNCHAVQNSRYASFFGLPVAFIGLGGYILIGGVWFWQRFGPPSQARQTLWALPFLAGVGLLFSFYLTFIEPFVIGASCLWCLGSALVITAIFCLALPLKH